MLEYKLCNSTGHTELRFHDDHVVLEWMKTSSEEREMLCKLLDNARSKGFQTFTVNDDEQPVKVTDKVPGMIFHRKSKLILKPKEGDDLSVQVIAKDLINARIASGKRLVMEATEDNEWNVLKIDEFELKVTKKDSEKKQVIKDTARIGGDDRWSAGIPQTANRHPRSLSFTSWVAMDRPARTASVLKLLMKANIARQRRQDHRAPKNFRKLSNNWNKT